MKSRLIYIVLGAFMVSCSAKKFLPEGELYFAGHEFEYNKEQESVPGSLRDRLSNEIQPDPVIKVLGSRPEAWFYGIAGETEKEKGIKYFIKYKLGASPVYVDNIDQERNVNFLESILVSEGFFRANVESRIDSSKREAKVVYMVDQGTPYRYDSLFVCEEPGTICRPTDSLLQSSSIDMGDLFSRTQLETQRTRIGDHFRSQGYYYFRPDYIKYQVDSAHMNHTVKVRAYVEEGLPVGVLQPYILVYVIADFSGNEPHVDTIPGRIDVITGRFNQFVKPEKILPFIALQPGEPFSLEDQRTTLRQLNRLEVFEYVNLRFTADTSAGSYELRAELLTSPRKKQIISTEITISTNSNNFTGPGIRAEYNNRNLFRGAEKLRISAAGRYETQLSGSRRGTALFEIDLQADLLIPRVSGPFNLAQGSGNVPRTKYGLAYRLFNQPDFYAQSAFGANYGYEWLSGTEHYHDLKIVNIDYLALLRSSEQLDALLADNLFFRESFANQVIMGPSYQYNYMPESKTRQRLRYFFHGAVDVSGNLAYLGNRLIYGRPELSEDGEPDSYTLFGVPFSQFTRLQQDHRLYIRLDRNNELVSRVNLGIGIPYANSNVLPFSKQFFVGGPSSLRAFQPRGLGPGTYFNPDQQFNSFFDQTGDLMIEFNLEHRFGLGSFFEGAIFTDIGNVWLLEENAERPGGKFNWDDFGKEMAVATGVGIRLDLSAILIRLDVAFPGRLPYLPEGERWVFDKVSFSRDWRRDNLIWNIGIGYPF